MNYSEKLKDPRWQKKRLEILQRDDFSCRICGDNESTLHIHHINYNTNPWETRDDLLITLCENCHDEETTRIKIEINKAINSLKNSGFISQSFSSLQKLFEKDRGWTFYDPAFDILKMIIDDDILWVNAQDEFFNRLMKKSKK